MLLPLPLSQYSYPCSPAVQLGTAPNAATIVGGLYSKWVEFFQAIRGLIPPLDSAIFLIARPSQVLLRFCIGKIANLFSFYK